MCRANQQQIEQVAEVSERDETNPYAPPMIDPGNAPELPRQKFEVRGPCLVVESGAHLPMRCVKTNETVTAEQMIEHEFRYSPPYRIALRTKMCALKFYVSERKRRQRWLVRVIGGALVVVGLALQAVGYLIHNNATSAYGVPLGLCGALIIISAMSNNYLRVVQYRDGRFWVTGFDRAFLAACAAEGQNGLR